MRCWHYQVACLLGIIMLGSHAARTAENDESVTVEKQLLIGMLPNGVDVLPDNDHDSYSIFSFSRGELRKNPFAEKEATAKSEAEFFSVVQKKRIGDLMYDDAEGGVLVIFCKSVKALGKGLLADLPLRIEPKMAPRALIKVKVGSRYMVRTVNGGFAVIRILKKDNAGVKIQWISQPNGGTSFRTSILDRKLGNILVPSRSMRDCVHRLRKRGLAMAGLRVCFESQQGEKLSGTLNKLLVKDATVRSLLDAIVKERKTYSWKLVGKTNVFCIFPARGSRLADEVPEALIKKLAKKQSWVDAVRSLSLEKQNVEFPPLPPARGADHSRLPPDKQISVKCEKGDTLLDVLGKVCWEYGEGMYFRLFSQEGKQKITFSVRR